MRPHNILGCSSTTSTDAKCSSWTAKKDHVSVGVGDLESTQAIGSVLKRHTESSALRGNFGGQSVGIGSVNERVPAQMRMTLRIRQRRNAALRLDEDLYALAANYRGEWVVLGLLPSRFEAELVAIECNRPLDLADDEEGRDVLDRSALHGIPRGKNLSTCAPGRTSASAPTQSLLNQRASVSSVAVSFFFRCDHDRRGDFVAGLHLQQADALGVAAGLADGG